MAIGTQRIFKTVVLAPGESFTLPPDGEIIFTSDSTSLDSDCEVPDTENYSCYKVSFGISETSGDDTVMEDDGTPAPTLEYIEISGTQYTVGYNMSAAQNVPLVTSIEAGVPSAIFKIYSVVKNNFDRRKEFSIKFKTFPSLVDSIIVKITGVSFTDGMAPFIVADTDCNCFTSGDDIYCNNSNT